MGAFSIFMETRAFCADAVSTLPSKEIVNTNPNSLRNLLKNTVLFISLLSLDNRLISISESSIQSIIRPADLYLRRLFSLNEQHKWLTTFS